MMKNEPAYIFLHKSDSNIASHDNIATIDQWHKERGFKLTLPNGEVLHVGYNWFIQSNGTVEAGRPENLHGAHCRGYNTKSIGICLHGCDISDFTSEQFEALAQLIHEIWQRYGALPIKGHYEADEKKPDCPGFDINEFMLNYLVNT